METAGELEVRDEDPIRQVSRDFSGTKDGQNIFLRVTSIVNGGHLGLFIGGRTGAGPEEYDSLVAAILDSIEVEYLDLASAPTPIKPTRAPAPTAAEVGAEVVLDQISGDRRRRRGSKRKACYPAADRVLIVPGDVARDVAADGAGEEKDILLDD